MLTKKKRSEHHRDVTYSMRKLENHFLTMHLLLHAFLTSLKTLWESAQLSSIILTSTSPITSVIDSRAPGCKLYLWPTTAHRGDSRRGPWLINGLQLFHCIYVTASLTQQFSIVVPLKKQIKQRQNHQLCLQNDLFGQSAGQLTTRLKTSVVTKVLKTECTCRGNKKNVPRLYFFLQGKLSKWLKLSHTVGTARCDSCLTVRQRSV